MKMSYKEKFRVESLELVPEPVEGRVSFEV